MVVVKEVESVVSDMSRLDREFIKRRRKKGDGDTGVVEKGTGQHHPTLDRRQREHSVVCRNIQSKV